MPVLWYSFSSGSRLNNLPFDNSNVMQVNRVFSSKTSKNRLYLGIFQISKGLYYQKILYENYSNCARHQSSCFTLDRCRATSSTNICSYTLPNVSGTLMKLSMNWPFFKQSVGKYFDFVGRPLNELAILDPKPCELSMKNLSRGNHVGYIHRMPFLGPFYMNGIKSDNKGNTCNNACGKECLYSILQSRSKSDKDKQRDKQKLIEENKVSVAQAKNTIKFEKSLISEDPLSLSGQDKDILLQHLLSKNAIIEPSTNEKTTQIDEQTNDSESPKELTEDQNLNSANIDKDLKDQDIYSISQTSDEKSKPSQEQEKPQERPITLNDLDLLFRDHAMKKSSLDYEPQAKRYQVSLRSTPEEIEKQTEITQSYENLMGNINQTVLEDLKKLPIPNNKVQATYVWVVENGLGVKDRVLLEPPHSVDDVPEWSGCNLNKKSPEESEFSLIPKQYYNNPFKPKSGSVLVLCDTYNFDEEPLSINKRAACLNAIYEFNELDPWFGFSQEYMVLDKSGKPFENKTLEVNLARELADSHANACLYAGIALYGMNLEGYPGKFEYQIGPGLGIDVADDLWISRFILKRIAEKMDITVSFNSKLMPKGELRTRVTFSTRAMRGENGIAAIKNAIKNLEKHHVRDSQIYNHSQSSFTFALGAKNASLRIPLMVVRNGFGYIEDCRPGANADPYDIVKTLLNTCFKENSESQTPERKMKSRNAESSKPRNVEDLLPAEMI